VGYWLISEHQQQRIRYQLPEGVTTVGRDAHSNVVLPAQTVSRNHAEIRVDGTSCVVTDLGSMNGTHVNGVKIESCPVQPGDVIVFGSVRAKISEHEDSSVPTWTEDDEVSGSVQLRREDTGRGTAAFIPQDSELLDLVVEAGNILLMPGDPGRSYDRLLEIVAKATRAKRILLLVTDDTGEPIQRAARVRGARESSPLMLSRRMVRKVLDEGASFLTMDAKSDEISVVLPDVAAARAVPLQHDQEILGILYADTDKPAAWTEHDLRVLALIGQILGTRIANQRLVEHAQKDSRRRDDLQRARDIQRRMLPQDLPSIPGYTMFPMQEMSAEVGGDLYDAGLLPGGHRVQIALGDVTGKSFGAALIMADVLATLRALRGVGAPLGELVLRLHRHLIETSEATDFVTLFVGEIDIRTHRLEYVNAGHPAPFLVLPDGQVQTLLEGRNFPVGSFDEPDLEFVLDEVTVPPHANLVLYSDGLTEAHCGDRFYEEDERFRRSLTECANRGSEDAIRCLRDGVDAFLGNLPLSDDITLLVVHRED